MALLILFGFINPGLAQTSSQVILSVQPEQSELALAETIDIAIDVQQVTDLYGVDLLLEFDAQAMQVVDMDPDLDGVQVQLGTFLDPGFVIVNIADNGLGRLRFAMTQLNPSQPKSGSGTLMVVRFEGKAIKENTPVSLLSGKLASPNGTYIEVGSMEDGLISVVAEIQGPTNTPIPAQPAGTPLPTATQTSPPPGVPTNPPGSSQLLPSPTNELLFIQPTTTLVLAQRATATSAATLTATTAPTASVAPTQTPLPTATDGSVESKMGEPDATLAALGGAPGDEPTEVMALAATPESSQRRIFSGGENLQVNPDNQEPGFNALWLVLLLVILGAAAWVYWKKAH